MNVGDIVKIKFFVSELELSEDQINNRLQNLKQIGI